MNLYTHTYIIGIYNHRKRSLKGYTEMLHKDAVSFMLKKKKGGTGSVTVTVRGFQMAPTREERQRRESLWWPKLSEN